MKRIPSVALALLVILSMVLVACGATPTATPVPPTATKAPAAPTATTAVAAPTATTAPAAPTATKAAVPTAAPTAAPVATATAAAPKVTAPFTLWHSWTDANELALLNGAVDAFKKANPGVTVNLLAVPFDQLKNKYTTEASTGGGPDLLIGPKDWIGELAKAKLVADVDTVGKDILADLNPAAVNANKFQGKVWAFPESTEAMALWYNKKLVSTPAPDIATLLANAEKQPVAVNIGFYQMAGFLFGFGGKLFDDNQKCIMDQGSGVVDALTFVDSAKNTKGVRGSGDGGALDALFKDGQVAYIFNGPWATGDYAKALGRENLGIAPPLKLDNAGHVFSPFLGTKNIFLSANSKGDAQKSALAFVKVMVSVEIQSDLTIKAGHIPANKNVKSTDPIVAGFITQTQTATYFPNEPEMGAVWTPGADMITAVFEGKAKPADAVKAACATINAANKK